MRTDTGDIRKGFNYPLVIQEENEKVKQDQAAWLILENGTVFEGKSFGADAEITGEIVFTTGMTGYLETLTDPSYYGQIILQTFPLIGNYGVIPQDFESAGPTAKGYIVKHPCRNPSNFRSTGDLGAFLKEHGIFGLHGIDTRTLTKIIRENGVMNGKITSIKPTEKDRQEAERYKIFNAVPSVSRKTVVSFGTGTRRVALIDAGAKRGIVNSLTVRGCEVIIFPYDATAEEILGINPNGIMISNGPGDPAEQCNKCTVDVVAEKFAKAGFELFGTRGTAAVLKEHGLKVSEVNKIHECRENNTMTLLDSGVVSYVVSTSRKGRDPARDSVKIRRKTCLLGIPCLTSIDTAEALAESLLSDFTEMNTELIDITKLRRNKKWTNN